MGAVHAERALILGGTGAVSTAVEKPARLPARWHSLQRDSAGINRYATAVAIATFAVTDAEHMSGTGWYRHR
jgi:hypothetical protein